MTLKLGGRYFINYTDVLKVFLKLLLEIIYCIDYKQLKLICNHVSLTLEGVGGGGQSDTPSIFLALNCFSLTDYQKVWHNCSLFVETPFDPN